MGRPDYIFGQFQETVRCRDERHGDEVCCAFAPQLVCFILVLSQLLCGWLRESSVLQCFIFAAATRPSFYRAMHFSANARSWDRMSSVRL